MARFLRRYLIITGGLAALVLAAPVLVILGMIALIVPGLILAAMPTAFLYGALFAVAWYPARHWVGPWPAAVLGAALAASVALGVPMLMNGGAAGAIATLREHDREVSAPAAVEGVLRIERDGGPVTRPARGEARSYACDDLCAAALFTPRITAVVLAAASEESWKQGRAREDLTATYRLAPRPPDGSACPDPSVPVESWGGWNKWAELPALRLSWKLALSERFCLERLPAGQARAAPDWRLRLETGTLASRSGPWALAPGIRFSRLALAERSGEVVRRTSVAATTLRNWLWVEPTGGLENFRFGWATRSFSVGEYDVPSFLADATIIGVTQERSAAGATSGSDLRAAITRALDRPDLPAGDAAFGLIRSYLDGFSAIGKRPDVRAEDPALLARLVADGRIRDFIGLHYAVKALGPQAATLREPIVRRVLASRYPGDREPANLLGDALSGLPVGLFAEPSTDERQLLADVLLRRWAAGLIRRQADRGAAAAPELVRIIAEANGGTASGRRNDEPDRLNDARAAVQALCVLGPEAASVLPSLDALVESAAVPVRALDGDVWRLALARMGKPVESFRKPENLSGTQEAFEDRLRKRLARFRPEDCR